MTELDSAPLVGAVDFERLACLHQHAEAEAIAIDPLQLPGGRTLLRARQGRAYVRDTDGLIVAVLNQDQA